MNNRLIRMAAAAIALAGAVSLTSCDPDEEYNPSQDPSEKIEAPHVSVAEGATVDAGISTILLTYSKPVSLNPSESVTLNDAVVSASVNAEDRCIVELSVALAPGTAYTLVVPERAAAVIGSTWFAPGVTVNFSTSDAPVVPTDIQPLINPNASAQAKNVHDFLVAEYGKHILSGAMANVNNNNDFADWLYGITAKYPAITGYDFIHLPESGQDWIDYNDIAPAKTQWQANGLVSYMWHWRVPTDEQAWKDKDYDRWGCRVPGTDVEGPTDFDITRALTPGTWENEFILEDLDKVSAVFKLLEAEGIPVLWRPLHEAAGSYKYSGAWFWWGAKGGEATKELWKLMYDRIVNVNGVNNLIWVWTSQCEEGYYDNMAADYPGNDFVDVVGLDVYADNDESQKEAFSALKRMTDGKKLLALSETGRLQSPEKCIADGAGWSWFNLWYTYDAHKDNPATDGFGNTAESIKAVFGSPYTINREDMPSLK